MNRWCSKKQHSISCMLSCSIIVLLVIPMFSHIAHAQHHAIASLPLSTLCLSDASLKEYFPDGISIYFVSSLSTIYDQPVEEAYYHDTGEYIQTRLITTKLEKGAESEYTIDFHPGFSLDPMFIIYQQTEYGMTQIGHVFGLNITFPGDGAFYVSGHTNTEFNQRRKFTIRDGQLLEIPQPFYYVGLETYTLKELDIYADKELTMLTAHLSEYELVTILLNSDDYYLIKTSRDILGWAKITVEQKATVLQGLYYFGD